MFQYFPKINYGFSGSTFEVTDIFKSVKVKFSNPDAVLTTTALPGERPDQLSYRLYDTPEYYWSLLLTNGVKNPFRNWAQSQDSYNTQTETEYDGWMYQFANNSQFLPTVGVTGFAGTFLKHYDGTDLSGILPGDLIIYETGSGPFSIKCYGAGGVTSTNSCGSPQYGQSLIPDNFRQQANIKQIAAGDNFTACLDTNGYIYAWGDIDLSSDFNKFGRLYSSKTGGYTYIDGSSKRIIAVNSNKNMECFGGASECFDFYAYAADAEQNVIKTSWSTNKSGGVAIKTDGTAVGYYFNPPASLEHVDCGYGYCVGVLPSTRGLTAFGIDAGNNNLVVPSGVTGITMISVSYTHALALNDQGTVYAWGNPSQGQTIVPSGTYKSISAGKSHSVAVDTAGKMIIWGQITRYGDNGASCPGVTYDRVAPYGLTGVFSSVASGYDHVVLQGTGTNKKYIGVVEQVDELYKRIFVKTYQFPDTTPVLMDDPSGTIVSVWRYNQSKEKYEQIKVIQHQLLSINKYLDTVQYISQTAQIVDPSTNDNWENVYLTGYQTPDDNPDFVTLRKQLIDVDLYKKTQIKQISLSGVKNLEAAITSLFNTNITNEITISDL